MADFMSPLYEKIQLKKPLMDKIPFHVKNLQMILDGKIPERIIPFSIVTTCRHMLRCVYGSDLDATIALKKLLFIELDMIQNEIEGSGKKRRKTHAKGLHRK